MHRNSNRPAALVLALVLLIAPVSLYAAPSTDLGVAGWSAAVLDTLDHWVQRAWSGLEGLVGTDDGLTDDQDPATSSGPDDPIDPDSGTEARPGFDPFG